MNTSASTAFAPLARLHSARLLFAASILCLSTSAVAALPGHLTATAKTSPAVVKIGGKGVLVVRLTVASGFHVNSIKPLDAYLIPTTVTVAGVTGVAFGTPVYPAAVSITEGSGKVLAYTNTVVVKIPFSVKFGARSGSVSGAVHYQACTSESCFPPTTAAFSAPITIK